MRRLFPSAYGQKLFLLATVPLILAVAAISVIVTNQARQLAETEIQVLETELLEAKKAELRNYVTLARNSFFWTYGNRAPDDAEAKDRVTQILAAMIYGDEGFYFVYDYDGRMIVSPRQTQLIGQDLSGERDSQGTPITDALIQTARSGAGYHTFLWPKPSTGEEAMMVAYVTGLGSWQWAMGTGVFIDDVLQTVAAARADVEARIDQTFVQIGGITLLALVIVFLSGLFITIRERRLADAKLKELTQRIIDTQEEERGRVARELHDSISQILVSVRYALETAQRRLAKGDERASHNIDRGITTLTGAIQEVRRISRDLRPGMLDDLGLGPALRALIDDFGQRTGVKTQFETVVFSNRLDSDSKITLYRIAQEALTNIERHAEASSVRISIAGSRRGALMRISDDGKGLPVSGPNPGLGLRNMQERIEQLDGTLRILSSKKGTTIEASVPLSHMLSPDAKTTDEKGAA
ncbi:cache domain-containing protein [Shimia ponticola]|uniref:cache domain-containing protein n=1 Tax=Shimia ponticola TaxID=2582893 RepID=UPI00210630A8|nr:cache domain-containing protein [Shimia ponticola]